MQKWLKAHQIKTIYIELGCPWQNGFMESFHGRFRDECLNREQLWTLTEARVVIEDYRREYDHFAAISAALSSASVTLRAPYADDGKTNPIR